MAITSDVELFVLVMKKQTNKQKQYGRAGVYISSVGTELSIFISLPSLEKYQ